MLVYVDDIITAVKTCSALQWFYTALAGRFNAKNLGEIKKILGIHVTRDPKARILKLDQE